MKKIKQLLNNNQGSVTVEFIFIFFLFSVLLIFLVDVAILQSTTGKLQRTSYSLLNVVKERNISDGGKEEVTQEDVNKLKKLAVKLMGETDENLIDVTVQYYGFEAIKPQELGGSSTRPEKKTKSLSKELSTGGQCKAAYSTNITDAAPLTENFKGSNRYAAIYYVTVCRKMTNLFKGLTLAKQDYESGRLRASALGVGR
ncbi:tight adherence protein F [Actinobacillus pleuropneumoniae]|uniref:Tight adherence protein F n=2 Tax=Actinobacillus pleuropneumoniae TaxID=715 RepID=E0F350_ACTPL|nr:tight adherence pilus pseudopilin TadF [Actinobacillus pleuropneumoniae]ADV41550.1 tight adherence protein F [Actinobacillus pleuropneumoniae serovar 9 str. CVJ13261]ADV41564.1 tight adherence protein F [Actinobacillus pleuropneumoniae serovar 10 str. D13039]EFM96878.1 Tight adherence protein F [Actinobacillus pleuropneumoniae serovar 10 str. D13039]UKH16084.1 tight adherence protein F [Actinobacillus pleuropneumoniae]UKH32450.1 tight adherence protein F [Actinobacillus pleuropneumoniae ser